MNKNYEKEKLLRRIRIIRGQLSAIERMIEEEKTPQEILPQLTAVRSAIHHVSVLETQHYVQNEIDKSIEQGGEQNEVYEAIEKLLDLNKNALFFAGDLERVKTSDSRIRFR
ncbi:hypothetical protein SDC9_20795 [bioreactor metagenome]|uniref:Transcriptional repressor FrmR n=1 Tax=bioreactor metagenome TaxID=1076179 RepID=A0A644U7Q5_9ZZZZ|nr:metal-sensitive transcriptional regulator [Desulfitobacterium hafniense]MEA5024571.1 metal-sensitive transcriptional regulator [Desulfitobacterium hafniense]